MTQTQQQPDIPELFSTVVKYGSFEELAAKVLTILMTKGGWMRRKDLLVFGISERECRLARQHSKATIIFGDAGYKATACATLEEIYACANGLTSRSKCMADEAQEYWKKYHRMEMTENNRETKE